ncbi:hypothetical protein CJF31_00010416 [Rutstroemia sp. NJR-2017a BVV2]|nr:hypothetical protein CJF31_00010416 [Rutstroemia sp. NJR-2017a BVV2]
MEKNSNVTALAAEMKSLTLSNFHQFTLLPFELRHKIYTLILRQPRTVSITCEKKVLVPTTRRYIESFSTTTPIPPLLHVSSESRREALKYYAPSFQTTHSPKYIYVNFSLDTIKLAEGILGYLAPVDRDVIQRLILHVNDAAYFGHFHMDHLVAMKSLKEIEMWAGHGEIYSWVRDGEYLIILTRDFHRARRDNLGWNCPRVEIKYGVKGDRVGLIEGGCWTQEEEETMR